MPQTHTRTERGYTLLLAVIATTLILLVAAFIVQVSRKQFILSAAARDSTYAFYAADAGIECAVANFANGAFSPTAIDGSDTRPGQGGTAIQVHCGDNSGTPYYLAVKAVPQNLQNPGYTYDPLAPVNNSHATSTFSMPVNYSSTACVWVKVGYQNTGSNITMRIEARGYNIGWNTTTNDCRDYGPRKVERALRLTYQ